MRASPHRLRAAAGYTSKPPHGHFEPINPLVIARTANVTVEQSEHLKRGELAYPDRRLVKYDPSKTQPIRRENIAEGIAHVVLDHPHPSWFTYSRQGNSLEQEARRFTLELLIPEDWLRHLIFGTDAPKTADYLAGRFDVTPRAIREFLRMLGLREAIDA